MSNVDAILQKYRQQVDEVLSGRGRVDAILRRSSILDSLNSGIPGSQAALPQYSRTMPDISGAPQDASESLSDIMSFVQGLPSGAVGDRGAPVNWGATDARRAGNRIDVQELLDRRSNEEAGAINATNMRQDDINAQLGQAGADARTSADSVASQDRRGVEQLIAEIMGMEAETGLAQDKMDFEGQLESDRLLAELNKPADRRPFVVAPGGAMFTPEGERIAYVPPKDRTSKLLSPEEEAQAVRLKEAGRAPSRSGVSDRRSKLLTPEEEAQAIRLKTAGRSAGPSEDGPGPGRPSKPSRSRKGGSQPVGGKEDMVQKRQDVKQARSLDAFEAALDTLDKGVEKHGGIWALIPGEEKGRLGTQFSIVQANLRELFNTGVLQPGELPFFERSLNNPTTLGALLQSGGPEGIQAQIGELRNFLKVKRGQLGSPATIPSDEPNTPVEIAPGALTAEEQDELEVLRQRFGR